MEQNLHHLIISKLNPLFESVFIYDSYACRTGKGTLFGIRRLDRFIRRASSNYTQDAYILKLDAPSQEDLLTKMRDGRFLFRGGY